jgi:hypothetical protein
MLWSSEYHIEVTMAEQKAQKILSQTESSQDAAAYCNNYAAHRVGITLKESTKVYDQWGTYDQVSCGGAFFPLLPFSFCRSLY